MVVTIVVLLILAGVSISLLLDENGIIAKSKDARLQNRASQVEDEIGMWKQNNFINKESNQAQEEADVILESLITRKLLKEDEIDREQEIITIKKNDGSILKEISYSKVTINISKNPETEKSGAVLLTVDSVEEITMPNIDLNGGKEELYNYIDSLSDTQKKEIIKIGYIKLINCTTFQEVLEWFKNKNLIKEATEESFWNLVNNTSGVDAVSEEAIGAFYNEDTDIIEGYTVTNTDGETSNTYIATENGTYTFKVKDNVTGKTYAKKVEVTNIDKSLPTNVVKTEIKDGWTYIYLLNILTQEYTTFEKAYIMLNGEKIEIIEPDMKGRNEYGNWTDINIKYNEIDSEIANTLDKLVEDGKLTERPNLYGTIQTFIIVKDGIEYTADVLITEGMAL